jgi:hypothetical protein
MFIPKERSSMTAKHKKRVSQTIPPIRFAIIFKPGVETPARFVRWLQHISSKRISDDVCCDISAYLRSNTTISIGALSTITIIITKIKPPERSNL